MNYNFNQDYSPSNNNQYLFGELPINIIEVSISDNIDLGENLSNKMEMVQTFLSNIYINSNIQVQQNGDVFATINENINLDTLFLSFLNDYSIVLASINENINLSDSFYPFSEYTQVLNDIIDFNIETLIRNDLFITLNENILFSELLNNTSDLKALISDVINFGFVISLNGKVYEAYCVNAENKALTKYNNYNFNSFSMLSGKYYGCKNDGIYLLDGDSDDGADIISRIKTGYIKIANTQTKDQGISSSRLKENRIECGFLVIKNNSQVTFRIIDENKNFYDYNVTENFDTEKIKLTIGKGIRTSEFQFEIESNKSWSLDEAIIVPIILNRRV